MQTEDNWVIIQTMRKAKCRLHDLTYPCCLWLQRGIQATYPLLFLKGCQNLLYQVVLFQTFCDDANMRVAANLNTLRDPVQLQGFKSMVRSRFINLLDLGIQMRVYAFQVDKRNWLKRLTFLILKLVGLQRWTNISTIGCVSLNDEPGPGITQPF